MTSALRWQLKKAARAGMALSAWVSARAATANERDAPQLRVLTYHRFGVEKRDPFCINPGDFEEQMHYLAEQRIAVSLADLQACLNGDGMLPPGAVLVTIDDGFRSLYTTAFPILKHYGIPAVAFISAGLINEPVAKLHQAPVQDGYLHWDELTILAASGMAIGSHAWTHRSLGRMSIAEAEHEANRSRETLKARLGVPIESFAYPFGTMADFNSATTQILKRAGYRFAFTSQHGPISAGMDALLLPRIKVESGERLWLFQLLVRGGLDAWSLIDKTLWAIQASRLSS